MDGFQKRRERTQENILRVSLELFRERGFKKVSIADIALRADVSPVTVYNHFNSKETLIREALKYLSEGILEKYQEIIKGDKPFLEKLSMIVFDKSVLISQFQGELVRVFISDPDLHDYYDSMFNNEALRLMSDLYNEGKKKGYVNPEISIDAFLIFTEILRQGIYHYPSLPDRLGKDPELAKQLTAIFVYGLNR